MDEDEFKRFQKTIREHNKKMAKLAKASQYWNNFSGPSGMPIESMKKAFTLKEKSKGWVPKAISNSASWQVSKQYSLLTSQATSAARRQKGFNALSETLNSDYLKKIRDTAEWARKASEQFKRKYPEQREVIDKIYSTKWSMGNEIGNFSHLLTSPDEFLKLSPSEMDEQYMSYYIDQNGVFEELKNIRDSLTIHRSIVADIITTLKESPNSWKLLYPQLFAIVDAILISQRFDGNLTVGEFSNFKGVKGMMTNSESDTEKETDIFKYVYYKTMEMTVELWKKQPFALPSEQVEFGRNSIQHGRYDPQNFTYKQFVQLVVFVSTLCIYNKR